jgi:hypothetical protein
MFFETQTHTKKITLEAIILPKLIRKYRLKYLLSDWRHRWAKNSAAGRMLHAAQWLYRFCSGRPAIWRGRELKVEEEFVFVFVAYNIFILHNSNLIPKPHTYLSHHFRGFSSTKVEA